MPAGGFDAFVLYRDSADRRAALAGPRDAPLRYVLFGLDELAARGVRVRHNLERRPPAWARALGAGAGWILRRAGGHGGDFAGVLASLRRANRADVVLSTVDTVGIPLLLALRAGLVRPPVVYVSIGLPERLERLRRPWFRRLYAAGLRRCAAIVAYSAAEAASLRELAGSGPPVAFVPFGVDVHAFAPSDAPEDLSVVAVGRDPYRDFGLIRDVAARRPELTVGIICSAAQKRSLGTLPRNVVVETELPLETVRDRMARARVVALPVRANGYSGATTTLLQAMALGKACVVSHTDALAEGYDLADGVNCRLVPPGDGEAFAAAVTGLLEDAALRAALGARARETVEAGFSWSRYADRLHGILAAAVAPD